MAEKFLTQEQLSVFCSSLAMLLRSGASLSEVSSLFEEDGMDTALRQASTEISLSVAAGETFSAAAEKTGVFPEYALSVFSTAELSGRLDEALEKCREETQMGIGIATAFAHQKILPAMYGKMLLGGAKSGELVQVTENLARRTAQEAENGLCSVIDRTEPILIGFLTASVGLTLLSVMLPLLGILSAI